MSWNEPFLLSAASSHVFGHRDEKGDKCRQTDTWVGSMSRTLPAVLQYAWEQRCPANIWFHFLLGTHLTRTRQMRQCGGRWHWWGHLGLSTGQSQNDKQNAVPDKKHKGLDWTPPSLLYWRCQRKEGNGCWQKRSQPRMFPKEKSSCKGTGSHSRRGSFEFLSEALRNFPA